MTLLLPRIHYGVVTSSLEALKAAETKIGTWPLELNPNISFVLADSRGCGVVLWGPTASPLKFCPMSDYFLMTSLFVLLSPRNTVVSCAGCSRSRGATMLLAFKQQTVLYLYCSQACCLSVVDTALEFLLNLKMDDYRNVLANNSQ